MGIVIQTATTNQIDSLESYASDGAYEAANGSGGNGNIYHNTTENAVRWYDGAWKTIYHVPGHPCTSYLGLYRPTATTVGVRHTDGSDLSASHMGFLVMRKSDDSGRLVVFAITSNVTLDPTGATMGLSADINEAFHCFYWINDDDTTPKLALISDDSYTQIADTATSITAADINTATEMLVSAAIDSGTWPCFFWGWMRANYDHTGGASEKLWTYQSDLNDVGVGVAIPAIEARYSTAAGQSIGNAALTIVDYGTKTFDPFDRVTVGGSWEFSCPIAGRYPVLGQCLYAAGGGWAAGEISAIYCYKNGTETKSSHRYQVATHAQLILNQIQEFIDCKLGDKLDIRTFQNSGASLALNANANQNVVQIYRKGGK